MLKKLCKIIYSLNKPILKLLTKESGGLNSVNFGISKHSDISCYYEIYFENYHFHLNYDYHTFFCFPASHPLNYKIMPKYEKFLFRE